MNTEEIIVSLEQERDRLIQAIDALQGASRFGRKAGGRRRRHLSAAARATIGAAMKRRWAERKKKEKAG